MKHEHAAIHPTDGSEEGAWRWSAFSVLLGTFLCNLDVSITNVALPAIEVGMRSEAAHVVWVVNAYQLALAVAVLPLASLSERFGYKHMFMTGLAVFTLASLLCVVAPSLSLLVAARALQGLGGACVSTTVPALLRIIFPARLVGTGIGYLALTVAIAAALGPMAAAAILSLANWRWLFAINIPIGMIGIVLAARVVPHSEGAERPFDKIGALLNCATLGLLIIGLGSLGDHRHAGAAIWAVGAGVACGALLVAHQRRRMAQQAAPLLPIDLLKIPMLRLSAATSTCSYIARTVAMLSLPFLLTTEMGRTAARTSLLMTPWALVIVLIAPLSGFLSDRFDADRVGAAGLVLFSVGLATLAFVPRDATDLAVLWRVILCGAGFGLFQTPNNRIMLISAPRERGGAASGLMTMARMIGMTAGAALATIMLELYGTGGAAGALVIATIAAMVGMAVGWLRVRCTVRTS